MLDHSAPSPTPTPPENAPLVSGCAFTPLILLSAFGLVVALIDGKAWSIAGFATFQIIALAAIWTRLREAPSWRAVGLGVLIGIGFYLLTFGLCLALL